MTGLDLGLVRCVKLPDDRRTHRKLPIRIEDGRVVSDTACGIRITTVDKHLSEALPTCKTCKETR